MPVLRKRAAQHQDNRMQANGLYVHSSPPRVLQINSAQIKHLIRAGDIEKLEHLVLDGQGKKLLGEYTADYRVRTYLKTVPALMSKISLLHDAVNSGRLEELQSLLDEEPDKKKKLVLAKDESGVGLLHKAVYYDLKDIAKWLIENFPHTVNVKDADGRTPYHYTPMCRDKTVIQKLLKNAGADTTLPDFKQHTPKYYTDHPSELELPSPHKTAVNSRKSTANRDSLVIKKSNIRIWIHQKNLLNLQQVVWEGQGAKLLVEHSNNAKVKRFLEAVPHIMGLIKDVHCDVQNDDLDSLKSHMSDPVPPVVLSGKDVNGLTPLHKASGLGLLDVAEYIIVKYPKSVSITDNEGRIPLHYASLTKDGGKMFDFLLESGSDESVLDKRQKTAAFYKTRSNEIDAKLIHVIPECPRMSKDSFPPHWDWSLLGASTPTEEIAKNGKKVTENFFGNTTEMENTKPVEEELKSPTKEVSLLNNNKEETEVAEHNNDTNHVDLASNDSGIEKEATETETAEDENKESKHEENVEESKSDDDVNEPTEQEANSDMSMEHANDHSASHQRIQTLEESEDIDESRKEEPAQETSEQTEEAEENKTNESKEESEEGDKSAQNLHDSKNNSPEKKVNQEKPEENGISDNVLEEGVIEGVVNGENEVESVNEDGQGTADDENKSKSDIAEMVDAGNMEQLAGMVLNGNGDSLKGQHSDNPELQSFLDNVPVYMSKINKIHIAARTGSLKDLQAALDRRKFAIAKDAISPDGASPLHVATIFGNTSIVRYLAGRFPETVSVTDDNGRTPLHYAATVADNGHYYNLLVHLGANIRTEDKFEHTPDYYRTNQEDFSHKKLLQLFGEEESTLDEMLHDKVPDDTYSSRKNLDDEEMIIVLEKCFNVLHGRRNSNAASAVSTLTSASITSTSQYTLSKHMRRYIFDNVKLRITRLDHNLYDIIWPSVKRLPQDPSFRTALEQDFPAGIVAPDCYVYRVFAEFLEPIIKDINCMDINVELRKHPESLYIQHEEKSNFVDLNFDLDQSAKNVLASTLDCTRNLDYFEFPKNLILGQLEDVERILTSALLSNDVAIALYPNASQEEIIDNGSGTYYTMNEVLEDPSEIRNVLASNGLLIPLWNIAESDRLHGQHWPYGRGVFVNNAGNFAAWINVLDHLRIVTCTSHQKPGDIGHIYSRIFRVMTALEKSLTFKRDEKLGYLSARPTSLGNTLQFNMKVRFPYLIKEPDNLRHLCLVRGLYFNRSTHTNDIIRIGNQQCLGITELQIFEDFATAVANILQLEKDLAMSNSMHIAALFVNIFKRKKANINSPSKHAQVEMPFFCTEEGRYLASSLGDPLIKGLTEVASKRPEDPIAYLATYLYNFANNNRGRSRGGTQETQQFITGPPQDAENNNAVPATIDVVTLEPDNKEEESAFNATSRDEHGQSMLHFAAARAHGRNALFQLLMETEINIGYRDELYRTARDISIQANIPENTAQIDNYLTYIATKGDTDKLVELLLGGYDHIIDIIDEENVPIVDAVSQADQPETVAFLQSILAFEERRERVHHSIREGSLNNVRTMLADENDTGSGKLLAMGRNSYGRCTLHVAVLCQQEEIVDYIASTFPDTLKVGDNLERTALHYAMGVEKIDSISRVLIKAGAKRVVKDLKGRQATYYFMNKSDILRLQEEEEMF